MLRVRLRVRLLLRVRSGAGLGSGAGSGAGVTICKGNLRRNMSDKEALVGVGWVVGPLELGGRAS